MSIPSSVRARRFANRPRENYRSAIAFQVRGTWCALAIETFQKVIPLESVYADPLDPTVTLTRYRDREIVVIDGGDLLFGDRESLEPKPGYLAIVRLETGEIGIAIDSPPLLCRVADSAVMPLSETSSPPRFATGAIRSADRPPIFLLDSEPFIEAIPKKASTRA